MRTRVSFCVLLGICLPTNALRAEDAPARLSQVQETETQDVEQPVEPNAEEPNVEQPVEPNAEERNAEQPVEQRMVGGHRLVPFRVVPWAVVATRVSLATSFGSFHQDIGNRTLSQLAFRETVTFQGAVNRWLGIEAELIGVVAAGSTARSVFDTGVNFAAGGRLGGVFRILHGDNYLLSARLDADLLRLGTTIPRRLFETIQIVDDALRFELPDLFVPATLFRLRPTLAFAAGLSEVFGVQAGAGFRFVSLWSGGDSRSTPLLDLALGVSCDLASVGLDLVVLLGGRLLQDLAGEEESLLVSALGARGRTRSELELAFYYSGRPDLDLGLAFTSDLSGDDRSFIGNLVMTYYW